jgi:hypothetical protein
MHNFFVLNCKLSKFVVGVCIVLVHVFTKIVTFAVSRSQVRVEKLIICYAKVFEQRSAPQ